MIKKLAEFFSISERNVIPVIVWGVLLTPLVFLVMYLFL